MQNISCYIMQESQLVEACILKSSTWSNFSTQMNWRTNTIEHTNQSGPGRMILKIKSFLAVASLTSVFLLYVWMARQDSYGHDVPSSSEIAYSGSEASQSETWKHLPMSENRSSPAKKPKILYWAKPHHHIDWTFPRLSNGDGGCDISLNRDDLVEADAVLFVMKTCKKDDLPPPQLRKSNQVYIWYVRESPWTVRHYYHKTLTEYDRYFNWTMSYRMDSDVVAAMWPTPAMDFLFQRIGRNGDMVDSNLLQKSRLTTDVMQLQVRCLMKKKNSLVAWIVSDCGVTNGAKLRNTIAAKLESNGIKLTRFGKCGGKSLPFNLTILYETLSEFKFYLAFENSLHCKDYLTEKVLYNGFVAGVVPVIYGPTKKDTATILPPRSYIHFEDFKTLKDLAKYLHYLDKNETAYSEYFKWWMEPGAQTFPRFGFNYGSQYIPRNPEMPQYNSSDVEDDWLENQRFALYHLCRRLKRGDHLHHTYVVNDLAGYWFGMERPQCLT